MEWKERSVGSLKDFLSSKMPETPLTEEEQISTTRPDKLVLIAAN